MDLLGGAGPASLSGSKFGTANNDLGFQKESYLADQRARKAAIDASIGSTGITERAIPQAEAATPPRKYEVPPNIMEKAGAKISDEGKKAGGAFSRIPKEISGGLADANGRVIKSDAAEAWKPWDPTEELPSNLKQKDSPITSIRRALNY